MVLLRFKYDSTYKKQFKHDGNMRNHLEMIPGCEYFEETLTSMV